MNGVKTKLLPHQAEAVSWMVGMEAEGKGGGMLFDDPGLGKTLTVLSLLATRKGRTLIVAPSSVTLVWEAEAAKHLEPDTLVVRKWDRGTDWSDVDVLVVSYRALVNAPGPEGKGWADSTGPFAAAWDRIVLDEAHYIKDHKCKTAKAAQALSGRARWVVTATPTMNRLDEMFGYLRFLRVTGMESYGKWQKTVVGPVERSGAAGLAALRSVLDGLSLRRRKELLGLPPRTLLSVTLQPQEAEARFQRALYAYTKTRVERLLGRLEARRADANPENKDGASGDRADRASVLKLVLRLRQAALSPDLVVSGSRRLTAYGVSRIREPTARLRVATAMLEHLAVSDDADAECRACLDDDAALEFEDCGCRVCAHCFDSKSKPKIDRARLDDEAEGDSSGEDENGALPVVEQLVCPSCGLGTSKEPEPIQRRMLAVKPELLSDDEPAPFLSSKLSWLVEAVRREPDAVFGIVSEWTTALDLIGKVLEFEGLAPDGMVRLDGRSRLPVRRAEMARFQDASGPRLALLSMMAVGEGVTLTRANRIVLMEPFWNEAKERQAADRAHRIGQTREVVIGKPVLAGSIEENVLRMQAQKTELAEGIVGDRKFGHDKAGWINNVRLFLSSSTSSSSPSSSSKKRPAQDADKWRRFAKWRKGRGASTSIGTSSSARGLADFVRATPRIDASLL